MARREFNDYSIFSKLGDLSNYNFETLNSLILNMEMHVEHIDIFKYVTWENNLFAITICFDSLGRFLQIEREVWKDLDVDINHVHED